MKTAVSRNGDDCERQEKNHKASLPKAGEITQRKSLFGSYADSDILLWLKGLAVDPCDSGASRDSVRQVWNQILKVRKVMFLSNTECPRRKRKLQQFLKGKFTATSGLASEKSSQQNFRRLSTGQFSLSSSVSCLLNSADSTESSNQQIVWNSHSSGSLLTFEDNFQGKQVSTNFSSLDNASDLAPPNKDISPLTDSDESVNGSNPLTPENLTLQDPPLLDFDDSLHSSYSSSSEEPKQINLQATRRSIRLLNFIGDYLPRMTIPVGPRFQANVLDWTGAANEGNSYSDSENSRWLGTQIWPMEGRITENTVKAIGKGRPDSCSCVSPGSADCIKHHILEERLLLQSDLGPAFLSWKFDEMGEVVSKSWTLKEQQSFESLVKMNPLSSRKNFWKNALKCLPSKCKGNIVSYYFNVFIPRRMSQKTCSSLKQIGSEDDEAEDVNHTDFWKRCRARSNSLGSSKNVKTRYLCRPC